MTDVPPATPPAAVAARLLPLDERLVVLDFDGTLSPIVSRPGDAALAPGARDAVAAVAARTPVAVLTGRPVADVLPRLQGLDVTVVGSHGTSARLPDGTTVDLLGGEDTAGLLDEVEGGIARLVDPADGWEVERKPSSVALHDRRVDDELRDELLPRVRERLARHLERPPGWKLLAGHRVTEFVPRGSDKGTALRWLLARHPGLRPLVVGDDVTDEDAFAVAVTAGGDAVVVADEPRPSAAGLRLRSPAEVVELLHELLAPDAGPGPSRRIR